MTHLKLYGDILRCSPILIASTFSLFPRLFISELNFIRRKEQGRSRCPGGRLIFSPEQIVVLAPFPRRQPGESRYLLVLQLSWGRQMARRGMRPKLSSAAALIHVSPRAHNAAKGRSAAAFDVLNASHRQCRG